MANEVRILVTADDKASAKLKGVGDHVGGLSSKLRGALLPAAVAAGAGIGILGAFEATPIATAAAPPISARRSAMEPFLGMMSF